MHVLQWIFGIIAGYFAWIFVLMEFAIDRQKPRAESGKLRVKADGIVIGQFFRFNIGQARAFKDCPRNLCELYWGIFGGFLFGMMAWTVCLIAQFFGFFAGFAPSLEPPDGPSPMFHPYQKYGSGNAKKWLAPWKIIVPSTILFFIREISTFLIGLPWGKIAEFVGLLVSVIAGFALVIATIVGILCLKDKLKNSASSELVMSIKKRFCPLVEPVYRDGRQG